MIKKRDIDLLTSAVRHFSSVQIESLVEVIARANGVPKDAFLLNLRISDKKLHDAIYDSSLSLEGFRRYE